MAGADGEKGGPIRSGKPKFSEARKRAAEVEVPAETVAMAEAA
ncbi:hypothetical protein BH18ACT12_BH18ACT12_19730 [soil metagenome]